MGFVWRALSSVVALLALAGCSTPPTFVATTGSGGGSSGVTGTGTGSTGTGAAQCESPSDCPGKENECSTRTCEGGQCGLVLEPNGFLLAAQAGGDCRKAICDGQGNAATALDDTDVPSDGNSCTQDVCSGGEPGHPAAEMGTPCGVGLMCNASGQCAGCTEAAQCGADTACTSYSCGVDSICVFDYTPAGQGDPGGQVPGDCYRLTCNGIGGTSTVPDDTDVFVDGNACTLDVCSMGVSSNPPAPAGTSCGGSFQCDGAGSCEGCLQDSDCGQTSACATYTCAAGTCSNSFVPAGQGDPGGQTPKDCQKKTCNGGGGVASVPDDDDLPDDGNPCTQDVCSGGVPSNPPAPINTPCGGNLKCNGAGVCTGCTSNGDCGSPSACATPICSGGSCSTEFVQFGQGDPGGQQGGNCSKNVCNGSGGVATIPDDGDTSSDGNPCTHDLCSGGASYFPNKGAYEGCPGGICNGGGSCVQCISDGDCGGADACKSPSCNGGSCANNYVPAGQGNPGGQQPGDCHTKHCNGSGGVQNDVDDGDTPNDGNACTQDVCSGGNPSNPAIPPQDDGNPCTSDVCNPGTGQTDHPAVGDGTNCGACQSCYGGTCYGECGGCDYCNGSYCEYQCIGACEYCNGSFCQWDPWCGPQP